MTQNVICKFYRGEAILCPSCEYGIIYSFRPSVFFHTYNDGTTRVDISMHMTCPYCGDDVLISGYGNKACHNYVEEHWTHTSRCKFSKIVFLTI